MTTAQLHSREEERLLDLARLRILDTVDEEEFDQITKLASYICDKPIALISLIDKKRQWFKSAVGITAKETPREFSFCAHAILQEKIFEIKDSRGDPRFSSNPLVTGESRVIHYAGAPLLGPSGLPIGTLCVIDNKPGQLTPIQRSALSMLSNQVSKLLDLRMQNLLSESKAREMAFYATAIENLNDGVVLQEPSGAIVSYNAAALRVLDLNADELLEKSSVDTTWRCCREDGSDFPKIEHPAMVTLRTGQCQRGIVMGVKSRAAEIRWIRVSSEPIFLNGSGSPSYAVTTFTDITEQKRNQSMLMQSFKLTSLGEMAAGIAHEINTPLAVISTSAELLISDVHAGKLEVAPLLKKAERILKTSTRIGAIVKGLRVFARDAVNDPATEVSLLEIIEDGMSFCKERFASRGIELKLNCSADLVVACVPTRLAQVIVNLLSNAFDAVSSLSEKWVTINAFAKQAPSKDGQNSLMVQVIDSGKGISDDLIGMIMTPFFTTKELGKGTGLGLSISDGIVAEMGGSLRYEFIDGHTAFVIELPSVLINGLSPHSAA